MDNKNNLFPTFTKSIEKLIEDEEGNIPGNKLLMLGTMVIILGSMMTMEVFAKHRSHSSHSSHKSHSSHSSHSSSSHGSHSSHESHQSHTSHSNTASHSSSSGVINSSTPSASKIPGIAVPTAEETFALPEVNQTMEVPNSTPASNIVPALGVPATTPGVKIDVGEINEPSTTEKIK